MDTPINQMSPVGGIIIGNVPKRLPPGEEASILPAIVGWAFLTLNAFQLAASAYTTYRYDCGSPPTNWMVRDTKGDGRLMDISKTFAVTLTVPGVIVGTVPTLGVRGASCALGVKTTAALAPGSTS